jgi:hypothetical protein
MRTLPHLFTARIYLPYLSQRRFHKSASLRQPHANIFLDSNSFLYPFPEGEFWSLGEESGISSSGVCTGVGDARIKIVTIGVRREKWRDPCMTSYTRTRKLTSFATLVTDGISRPVQAEELHTHAQVYSSQNYMVSEPTNSLRAWRSGKWHIVFNISRPIVASEYLLSPYSWYNVCRLR